MGSSTNKAEQIFIFDTTLRDGQQCPGAGMSPENNITYALLAADAQIDVVEAGFPSASSTDFEIVKSIATEYAARKISPLVCGLTQLRPSLVDKTIEALLPAGKRGRVHIYLPVDPNLMVASLGEQKIDKNGFVNLVHSEIVKVVKSGLSVEFSPEGYSRVGENFDFCTELLLAAVDAGATVLNCPDTIGGASPFEGTEYFVSLMNRHKAIIDTQYPNNQIIWSTHCHNDLGLALSNSMEAITKGPARQIEGCINGIGERAGNVSLEQCIMNIHCFGKEMPTPLYTNVKTEHLKKLSDFIALHMLPRQPNWPICGDNAAKHSSGGHTNAIISNPLAYQPFNPEKVGAEISFIFGPLSGSNHAQQIIEKAGYLCDDHEKTTITQFIKDFYSERRKGITDEELLDAYKKFRAPIKIDEIYYARERGKVRLTIEGVFFNHQGTLTEEIDACDSALTALKMLIDKSYPGLSLEHYASHSSDPTIHAVGLCSILLKDTRGNTFLGHGEDRDTQLAAMKALIDATNLCYISEKYMRKNAQNIIDKIWSLHTIEEQTGFPTLIGIDLMLIHEVTSAQAFETLRERSVQPFDTSRLVATLDHSIPTRTNRLQIYDDNARIQVEKLRTNAKEFGVTLFDFDSKKQGIVHVIGPELGLIHPGMTIVCGDSHTSTHGAFGALAFGIGTTEVSQVLAASALLLTKPKTMKVEFIGKRRSDIHAKDLILKLIATIGVGGANGHIIEYVGDAIREMSMEERMTICNMSIECGARAGLIAPDETTFEYIKSKQYAPSNFKEAKTFWKSLQSDHNAVYDTVVTIDITSLSPMVTWGTNPSQACEIDRSIPELSTLDKQESQMAARALEYHGMKPGTKIKDIPIEWAFLGSCTNGRIEDLRIAADILKGKKIHHEVTFYVVPGSEAVREQAISEGLDKIFIEAGAEFRMPGCSMCLGMNDDHVPAGKRCISSSNRNFVGRQGKGSFTHLASPATVAASALRGKISSIREL